MKKIILLTSVLFMSLSAISLTTQAQNTTVSGQLKGLSGGTVKIFYNKDDVSRTDTVTATGDTFTWKINLKEPIRIALTADSNNYYFFAEPGRHIEITGIKDSTQSYILSGSPMQQDADAYRAYTNDLSVKWDSLYSVLKSAPTADKAAIEKQRADLRKQFKSRAQQFIADHPNGFFSLYLVRLERDYKGIKQLYNELGDSIKQTSGGKEIAQRLKTLEKSQIGVQMADFTQADTSGKPVKLSRFRGKYVLVDFWASWCMPCRAENPNVLKAYHTFKDKGFTVVGISLDDKAANWKKAIRADKLPWTQLSDLKGWKNEIAIYFGIQAIPSNFLLDPTGKIIAKDLRGKMLEDKLKEVFN